MRKRNYLKRVDPGTLSSHGDSDSHETTAELSHSGDLRLKTRGHLETLMNRLRGYLEVRYKEEFRRIEVESEMRKAGGELAMFSHPILRFGVFLGALAAFFTILSFTAPPRGIVKALEGKTYVSIKNVELCFGQNCLSDPTKIHHVTLPFFNISEFKDFQPRDLYYRMKPRLSDAQIAGRFNTILFPIPWGNTDIYRSGTLLSGGVNFQPVASIVGSDDDFVLHVKTPSGGKFGLRGIFQPIVGDSSLIREIERELNGEPFKLKYALVAQLSGICLLLIMFLTFPYRPELFAFLVMFGFETLRSSLIISEASGTSILPKEFDLIVQGILMFAGAIASLFFIGLFCRRSIRFILNLLSRKLLFFAAALFVGYFVLTTSFDDLSSRDALYTVTWSCVLWFAILLTKDCLLFLFQKQLNIRFFLTMLGMASLAYWVVKNNLDHIYSKQSIESNYQNHLHFFYSMSAILAVEIGRTEIKIKEAFSFLPREVVRLIHDKKETWREGFIVLVDVVGWTSKLQKIDVEEIPEFCRVIDQYLLSFFENEPHASVVAGTGDGFYFTFEGPPRRETIDRLIKACQDLAQNQPRFRAIAPQFSQLTTETLIVRSAIAYGRYYTSVVQSPKGILKRDHCIAFELPLLQRVIGNDRYPKGPRVLSHKITDQFRNDRPLEIQTTKNDSVAYWLAS